MKVAEFVMELFPKGGYYVEAGAHDGIGDSQTKVLEDTGKWNGICVEPSSAYLGLQRHRKCHVDNRCLYSRDDGQVLFREMIGNDIELSGIPQHFGDHWDRTSRPHTHSYKTSVTLQKLLEEHKAPFVIELLCLDTEGSELEILNWHDFSQYYFLVAQVEHNGVQARRAELAKLLRPLEYDLVDNDGTNDTWWYKP